MILEEEALQLRQAAILQCHYLSICDRLACVVVYGEVLVEMEQVDQLAIQLACNRTRSSALQTFLR